MEAEQFAYNVMRLRNKIQFTLVSAFTRGPSYPTVHLSHVVLTREIQLMKRGHADVPKFRDDPVPGQPAPVEELLSDTSSEVEEAPEEGHQSIVHLVSNPTKQLVAEKAYACCIKKLAVS